MKLKNSIFAGPFVQALVRVMDNEKLILKESWPLIKLAKKIEQRGKAYQAAAKLLFQKYATKNEEGQQVIQAKNAPAFNLDMEELNSMEEDYDIPQLPVALDLKRISEQEGTIKATDLVILEEVLKLDESALDALCG